MRRREFAMQGATVAMAAMSGRGVLAQDAYPNKPIRLICPYPAGGIVDVLGRAATEPMSQSMSQRIVVDNRPGADGRIGLDLCAKAPADGYTLVASSPILVVNEFLQPDPSFHVTDFTSVGAIASSPAVYVVANNVPARSMKEFIDYARARPGQLNVANPGTGSSLQLAQELLFEFTRVSLQNIAYKGQPPSIADLIQGQVSFALISLTLIAPHIQAGRVRALAVNSEARVRALPDVPTIAEAGYRQAQTLSWYGIAAPAKTPRPIVDRLSTELQRSLKLPATQSALDTLGAQVMFLDAARMDVMMREEHARWGKLIRERGIRAG